MSHRLSTGALERWWVGLFVALVAGLLAAPVSAGAETNELEFVSPEIVTASFSGGEDASEFSVWLKNTGDQEVTPEFKLALENADGVAVASTAEAVGKTTSVAADSVARFRIRLSGASKSSGQLVAQAPGSNPASVAITVGPKLDLGRGVNGALIVPFIIALILVLIGAIWAGVLLEPGSVVGAAELEFSKAFASTLTAVGALLGTIISASVLPEDTVNLSKAGFTGLNLTFGLAIAVSGVVYGAVQKTFVADNDGKKEWKLKGYALPFLLAALITTWAVYGEIWTMWRMFEEIGRAGQGFSGFAVTVVRGLLILAAIAVIPYTLIRIRVAVRAEPSSEEQAVAVDAQPARVSLL